MIIDPILKLPAAPSNEKELVSWAQQMQRVIGTLYQTLAMRTEEMIMQGTFAQMPTANGRQRLYWATDTSEMYYDDGAWTLVW